MYNGSQCRDCDHLNKSEATRWCQLYATEPKEFCHRHTRYESEAQPMAFFDNRTNTAIDATDATDLGMNLYMSIPKAAPPDIFKSGGGGDFGGAGASGSWELPSTPAPTNIDLSDHVDATASVLAVASEASASGLDAVLSVASAVVESAGDALSSVADVAGDVFSGLADAASSIDLDI